MIRPFPTRRTWTRRGSALLYTSSSSALWTPASLGTPLFSVDIPAARAAGRLFTTDAKTTVANTLSAPIGAIVQESGLAYDLTQSNTSRRYYLDQMSDGQWSAAGDNVDDSLQNNTMSLAPGPKTFGFRFEYYSTIGSSEVDGMLVFGGAAATTRVFVGGPTYANPGLFWICDTTGAGSNTVRYAGLSATANTPYAVVITYNGGPVNIKTSYRLFVNNVEIPNSSLVGGSSAGGVTYSTLLCFTAASLPAASRMSKAFAVNGEHPELATEMYNYLLRPLAP